MVGAVRVRLCATEPPAAKLAVLTVAKLLPAALVLLAVIRTSVVEAPAAPVPWFVIDQLAFTEPPPLTDAGLTVPFSTRRSGSGVAAVTVTVVMAFAVGGLLPDPEHTIA